MKKVITCNKCGKGGLVWATSKAGKYYLTDKDLTEITGENGRVIKTLQLAHKCLTAEEQEVRDTYSEASDRAQEIKLQIAKLDSDYDARRDSDEFYELKLQGKTDSVLEAIRAERDALSTELKALQIKYNDNFNY